MITEINGLSVLGMGSESDKWMIGEIEKWLARLAPDRCRGVSPRADGLRMIEPQMNRMDADEERFVLIGILARRTDARFSVSLLILTSICVHLRFIFLFRINRDGNGEKV
jgi:hypothetical protein